MKKILKGACQKFVTACQKCACEFEYEFKDIVGVDHLTVVCPDCGFYTQHDYEDGVNSSRKGAEPEKPQTIADGWCCDCGLKHPTLFLLDTGWWKYWLCESCYNHRKLKGEKK
jgi:hypothetical protein